ncbi:MAG TPA: hypothetical protein ENI68_10180 [Gammaproteobacteria bacterium]|nr:hypothetical protein [Gammaproteobacteria bacterium]
MGNAIRKIINLGKSRTLSIEIPSDFGDFVELILLPCDDDKLTLSKVVDDLSEDEVFLASAYSAVIEDDAGEDKIWEAYLHAS